MRIICGTFLSTRAPPTGVTEFLEMHLPRKSRSLSQALRWVPASGIAATWLPALGMQGTLLFLALLPSRSL